MADPLQVLTISLLHALVAAAIVAQLIARSRHSVPAVALVRTQSRRHSTLSVERE